jgi:hypothetical protein
MRIRLDKQPARPSGRPQAGGEPAAASEELNVIVIALYNFVCHRILLTRG